MNTDKEPGTWICVSCGAAIGGKPVTCPACSFREFVPAIQQERKPVQYEPDHS